MKKGDLVRVHPAQVGLYLIIDENCKHVDCVTLYGRVNDDTDEWFCAPMNKKWIEIVSEGK